HRPHPNPLPRPRERGPGRTVARGSPLYREAGEGGGEGPYRFTFVSSCCGRRERALGNSEKVRLTYCVTVSTPLRYCSSSGVTCAATRRSWRDGSSVSKRAQNQGSPRVRIRSFSGRCHSKAQLRTRGQSWMGKRPPIISPGRGGRRK